jgi:hypothetical protein
MNHEPEACPMDTLHTFWMVFTQMDDLEYY